MNILIDVSVKDELTVDYERMILLLSGEMIKYKAMWFLRQLESEIDFEKGQIIVKIIHDGPAIFEINNFSKDLENKIRQVISVVDFGVFG